MQEDSEKPYNNNHEYSGFTKDWRVFQLICKMTITKRKLELFYILFSL